MKNNQLLTYGSIIIAMLCWSLSFVWVKIVYQAFDPITTVFFRLIISSAILLIIGRVSQQLQKIEAKDRMAMFLLALLEPFLYFMGESIGLKFVSSTLGSVIISTIPLFAPIAAYYFFKEQLSPMNLAGIFLSIIGVGVIILNKNLSLIVSPIGLSALMVAVASGVGYSVVLKKIASKYNSVTIITYQNAIGILLFLPFFLYFDLKHFLQAQPTADVWIALTELAIFGSTIAFGCFTFALRNLGVTKSNIFINVIPVFTAIFAYFVLKDTLGWQKIIGILIVISGLFLSQIKIKRKLKIA